MAQAPPDGGHTERNTEMRRNVGSLGQQSGGSLQAMVGMMKETEGWMGRRDMREGCRTLEGFVVAPWCPSPSNRMPLPLHSPDVTTL